MSIDTVFGAVPTGPDSDDFFKLGFLDFFEDRFGAFLPALVLCESGGMSRCVFTLSARCLTVSAGVSDFTALAIEVPNARGGGPRAVVSTLFPVVCGGNTLVDSGVTKVSFGPESTSSPGAVAAAKLEVVALFDPSPSMSPDGRLGATESGAAIEGGDSWDAVTVDSLLPVVCNTVMGVIRDSFSLLFSGARAVAAAELDVVVAAESGPMTWAVVSEPCFSELGVQIGVWPMTLKDPPASRSKSS